MQERGTEEGSPLPAGLVFQKRINKMSTENQTRKATEAAGNITGAAMFGPLAHPIVSKIDPGEVTRFLKGRNNYLIKVQVLVAEVPGIKANLYSASINRALLKTCFPCVKLRVYYPKQTSSKK